MRLLLGLLLFFIFFSVSAQEWSYKAHQNKNKQDVSFLDIENAFETFWADKEITKGSGYNPFKSKLFWLNQQINPDGSMPAPNHFYKEWLKYQTKNSYKTSGLSDTATWSLIGPEVVPNGDGGQGRINIVTPSPYNPNIILIGTAASGLWQTNDGGTTWTINAAMDKLPNVGISDIVYDPIDPNTIYVATGDADGSGSGIAQPTTTSLGLLKSTDNGSSWSMTGLNWDVSVAVIRKIDINKVNNKRILAATDAGLYLSLDAGTTWATIMSNGFFDVIAHPTNPSIVYAAQGDLSSFNVFYKSTDSGSSFSIMGSGQIPSDIWASRLEVSDASPNTVYVIGANTSGGLRGIYRSTDAGATWNTQATTPDILANDIAGTPNFSAQGWYDLAFEVDDSNANILYVGGINIWKSTNAGVTWNIISYWSYPSSNPSYVHADIHDITISPFSNSKIYAATDGAMHLSSNSGNSWTNISNTLSTMQFYRLSSGGGSFYSTIYAGAQDNGINKYDGSLSPSLQWDRVNGGDGMNVVTNPSNALINYAAIQRGDLRKTSNGGVSYGGVSPPALSGTGYWVTPFVINPNNALNLFIAYKNVWKTTNSAASWTSISSSFLGNCTALAIAPSDENYIYASAKFGVTGKIKLYATQDGGSTIAWTEITPPFIGQDSLYITDIVVSDNDPLKVWITLARYYDGHKVYYSEDGGMSWANISKNLPNVPVYTIAYQPFSPDAIYIGTELGVYYTNSSTLNDWTPFNEGMPIITVSDLEINNTQQKIRAATFGRGIWESDIKIFYGVGVETKKAKELGYISTYPNPSTGNINIDLNNIPSDQFDLQVQNTLGQTIKSITNIKGDKFNLNIKDVENGAYFITIIANGRAYKSKILITK